MNDALKTTPAAFSHQRAVLRQFERHNKRRTEARAPLVSLIAAFPSTGANLKIG